jgi:LemA protein
MSEWIALALIGLVIIAGIVIYYRLVTDAQRVKSGWSDIEVQLKRRHDLIPKLVAAVKQYASYEQATLEAVTALRTEARQANAVGDQASLETRLSTSLISIYALQESYPELKASQSFLQLQTEITAVEGDIQFSRRYYNGAVRNLNTRIESFPDMLVARLFDYQPASYFELEEALPG